MEIEFDQQFRIKYDKVNVRIKNYIKNRLRIFRKNPRDTSLNNHPLRREWEGYRSINITNDYRAIYKEEKIGKRIVAYFVTFGTHDELYKSN